MARDEEIYTLAEYGERLNANKKNSICTKSPEGDRDVGNVRKDQMISTI